MKCPCCDKEIEPHQRDVAFASIARDYCTWAESPAADTEETEARKAISKLANLYSQALTLSPADPGEDISDHGVETAQWQAVFNRFSALPLNYYSEIFSPANSVEEEPVVGDLADDLADIYRDIKQGLRLYDAGHIQEALWDWKVSFNIHWGRHACSALHALHAYATDQGIEL